MNIFRASSKLDPYPSMFYTFDRINTFSIYRKYQDMSEVLYVTVIGHYTWTPSLEGHIENL